MVEWKFLGGMRVEFLPGRFPLLPLKERRTFFADGDEGENVRPNVEAIIGRLPAERCST